MVVICTISACDLYDIVGLESFTFLYSGTVDFSLETDFKNNEYPTRRNE
jgi:hypothetical protein